MHRKKAVGHNVLETGNLLKASHVLLRNFSFNKWIKIFLTWESTPSTPVSVFCLEAAGVPTVTFESHHRKTGRRGFTMCWRPNHSCCSYFLSLLLTAEEKATAPSSFMHTDTTLYRWRMPGVWHGALSHNFLRFRFNALRNFCWPDLQQRSSMGVVSALTKTYLCETSFRARANRIKEQRKTWRHQVIVCAQEILRWSARETPG